MWVSSTISPTILRYVSYLRCPFTESNILCGNAACRLILRATLRPSLSCCSNSSASLLTSIFVSSRVHLSFTISVFVLSSIFSGCLCLICWPRPIKDGKTLPQPGISRRKSSGGIGASSIGCFHRL